MVEERDNDELGDDGVGDHAEEPVVEVSYEADDGGDDMELAEETVPPEDSEAPETDEGNLAGNEAESALLSAEDAPIDIADAVEVEPGLDEIDAIDESDPNGSDASEESAEESDLADQELDRVVEAVLFASPSPLTAARIAKVVGVATRRIRRSIGRLRREYADSLRAFDVVEIAGGFKLYSRPEYQEYLLRLEKVRAPEKLSASSLETLAIVAYRQPIIRADIDSIRGVQSGAILRSLMERKLVRVVGRSDQPGRPLMYGTTKRFLDHFGLSSVKDLPRVEDLKAP